MSASAAGFIRIVLGVGLLLGGSGVPLTASAAGRALPTPAGPAGQETRGTLAHPWSLPASLRGTRVDEPWHGDLDGIVDRRLLRAVVTPSRTGYFLDGPAQRGIAYEALAELERFLNERYRGDDEPPIFVVIIPVSRDRIAPLLASGRADLAVAGLTVIDDPEHAFEFTAPVARNVRHVLVTGSTSATLPDLAGLAGRTVTVRRSSPYWRSLTELDAELAAAGRQRIRLQAAPEYLQDEDLLEMAAAGLVDVTVTNDRLAELWHGVLPDLRVHSDAPLDEDVEIAWGVRFGTPALREVLDEFIEPRREGTLFGNVLRNRYLGDPDRLGRATDSASKRRFEALAPTFRRWAAAYDFDWLMAIAQGYQESRLDPATTSAAGAVGVMQLLPSTALDPRIDAPDYESPEGNIRAGLKYMRLLVDEYFPDPSLDRADRFAFALAAYNAGPSRIASLRRVAADRGLDPDRWFGEVELVVAEEVGSEPVRYVGNVFKYYVAYRLMLQSDEREVPAPGEIAAEPGRHPRRVPRDSGSLRQRRGEWRGGAHRLDRRGRVPGRDRATAAVSRPHADAGTAAAQPLLGGRPPADGAAAAAFSRPLDAIRGLGSHPAPCEHVGATNSPGGETGIRGGLKIRCP